MAFTDLHVISEMFDGLSGCFDRYSIIAKRRSQDLSTPDSLTIERRGKSEESTKKYKLQTVSSRLTKQQKRDAARAESSAEHEQGTRIRKCQKKS